MTLARLKLILSGNKNGSRVLCVALVAMFAMVFPGRAGELPLGSASYVNPDAVMVPSAISGGDSRQALETSPSPIVTAARGLIERVLPKQAIHFVLETIPADHGYDVFEVAGRGDEIILRGNNGVAIASALNWYLQHECHCDISWNCGNQLNLPQPLPVVPQPVRVLSPYKYRYAYNFCTHGYTMAWWHWPQWQRELDFLALKGINLALVIEGQESVWINTFTNFGYAPAQIRSWVPDPAHLPWFEMDNLESYGGPLSQDLVEPRLKLGQKILTRMRELGIKPMLPGYYGMVPPDFHKRFPKADVRLQGDWDALKRPDILDPTDPMFPLVAAAYYAAQHHLFGGAQFYDADPFHEGGRTKGFDLPATGRAIFNAMNAPGATDKIPTRPDGATWVLQSWEKNPRPDMIAALDKNRLLVLDLWCEAQENWRLRNSFDGVPWLWCTVETFGGNVGLGGHLDAVAKGPARALADPRHGRLAGIGATMEGSQLNPVVWELFFGNAWRTNAPNLEDWLADYAWRRYGAQIPAADQTWQILAATVYHAPASLLQLPINSVICARPSLNPAQNAREWASTQLYYDPTKVVEAWKLLLEAAPEARSSDGYRYDLCDVGRQALADLGARYHRQIIAAYKAHDAGALRGRRAFLGSHGTGKELVRAQRSRTTDHLDAH
jgi:alpha-N-acetylglucosaminidase